jgi:tRNA modification GTPase
VRLVDTAGMTDTPDRLEAMGMEVSARYLAAADLVIRCVEAGKAGETGEVAPRTTTPEDVRTNSPASPVSSVLVRTKSDLSPTSGPGLPVSSVTGDGIAELRRLAGERLFGARLPLADLEPALTRARHREALARARTALAEAREHLLPGGDAVLVAHHVRQATRALDALVGTVDLEEILDRVFAGFCVGK